MKIRIRYFASIREVVEESEEVLTLPEGTQIMEVRDLLVARYPRLEPILARSVSAVNHTYMPVETELHENDELVFIPPMGGGQLWSR